MSTTNSTTNDRPAFARAPLGALSDPALRFLIAGGLNAALNLALFRGLLRLFGDRPGMAWVAQAVAYAFCVAVSYVVNRTWTFRSGGAHGRQLPRFVTAHFGSLVLSSALIQTGVGVLHRPPVVCWVFATGVTTLANFVLQRFWVFAPAAPPTAR